MNELSLETSPYLLQHAANPVYWKAWSAKTLSGAKEQGKLMIISIGYSACHWCHVMEHETFEDVKAASTMNAHFVSIKIDREERPDIDAIYMKAVQIMTGHGGWPLNIVALPDGRPVWGGTYFRKNEWIETLENLQEMYAATPQKVVEYAERLHGAIQATSIPVPAHSASNPGFDSSIPETLVLKWAKSFDHEYGGMARAPKFMMPDNYKFLMRYAAETQNTALHDFVDLTLTKMAYGGLFDTIGGGFSRYSVDLKWHVPHFEKMLYDNGQLVSVYADAYKRTKKPLYKEIIEKTLQFVSSELMEESGGFYCALDADSLDGNGHLEEGAFYAWEKEELQELLKHDFEIFAAVFNINDFGHWEKGRYVLIQDQSLEQLAAGFKMEPSALESKKREWEAFLFSRRQQRSRPRLDDKCLTSWNALMLKGFADAYKALQREDYLDAALKNAFFIRKKLWSPDGNLFHTYKNGIAAINGYLEDYSFVIQAFISLYEITLDEKWLLDAKQLADYCFEHFFDAESGFFLFASQEDEALIARHFETEDNVIPSSNSVMADNLLKLGLYFENGFYEKTAKDMVQKIVPTVDYPSAFSNWLNVYLDLCGTHKELAITGAGAPGFVSEINSRYIPGLLLSGSTGPSSLPFLANRYEDGKTLLFLCRNKTCGLPTEDFSVIEDELAQRC